MRFLALIAVALFGLPLAACGTTHEHTTVVAQPGSTVVAPDGAKIVTPGD